MFTGGFHGRPIHRLVHTSVAACGAPFVHLNSERTVGAVGQQCSLRYVPWASVWLVWVQDPIDPQGGRTDLGRMARLVVLVSPPRRLKPDEAEEWLRRELASVVGVAGLRSAALSRLASASSTWTSDWGWLVEFEFETAECARGAVRDDAWGMLLGDLRLLGMSPTVALVDSAAELMS